MADDLYAGSILVDYMINPSRKIPDPILAGLVSELRQYITLIPQAMLDMLPMDNTSTEVDAVYFDAAQCAVYKVYLLEEGQVIHGLNPGELLQGNSGHQLLPSLDRYTSLLDYLDQIEMTNMHGGAVYTEITGFTEDGNLVVKQPYVLDLHIQPDHKTVTSLEYRGFRPVRNMDLAAVAFIDSNPFLFVDMHGENVMSTSGRHGPVDTFLVDATCRKLTAKEFAMLEF